jgi:hypothetical protein
MSEEELRDNINRIAQKIMEVEEVAKKKENYITNKINEEFNSKIKAIDLSLLPKQERLNQIIHEIDLLDSEKKKLDQAIKDLQKESHNLKLTKEKMLNKNLKAINNEKKNKTKTINTEIKSLEKELKSNLS